MNKEQLHRLNTVFTWLIAIMAVVNVAILVVEQKAWDEIMFRSLQYVAMLLIMQLPVLLKIIGPEDVPLCGHEALRDSMGDLILDLLGALLVAIYGFIRHDKLIERYKQYKSLS